MKRLCVALAILAVSALASMPVAGADQPPPQTFVAVLSAEEQVPHCAQATNAAQGLAVFHVVFDAGRFAGVEFKVVANNLPGDATVAHIHRERRGVQGPIVEVLNPGLDKGGENGVITKGSFFFPQLVAAIQTDPLSFYVDVHSSVCRDGVIRGQIRDAGEPIKLRSRPSSR